MLERRMYSRININNEGCIYINNDECPMLVQNISEDGLSFLMGKKIFEHNKFTIGDCLTVLFIEKAGDEYIPVEGTFKVKRISDEDYFITVGCYLRGYNKKYTKYVENKKVEQFLNQLCGCEKRRLSYETD